MDIVDYKDGTDIFEQTPHYFSLDVALIQGPRLLMILLSSGAFIRQRRLIEEIGYSGRSADIYYSIMTRWLSLSATTMKPPGVIATPLG